MGKYRRANIKIVKENEMRSKGISTMISEGGLGADKYYDIIKKSSSLKNKSKHKELG